LSIAPAATAPSEVRSAGAKPRSKGRAMRPAQELAMYWRLARRLRRFIGERDTVEQGRALLRERLANREPNFLRLAERSIYGHSDSPYLPLLREAGCELGDLRRMVTEDGLESSLRKLRAAGVYVGFEESKGRHSEPRLREPASALRRRPRHLQRRPLERHRQHGVSRESRQGRPLAPARAGSAIHRLRRRHQSPRRGVRRQLRRQRPRAGRSAPGPRRGPLHDPIAAPETLIEPGRSNAAAGICGGA
jgi:hypothetical protein